MQGRNQLDVIGTNISLNAIPLFRSGKHVARDQDMNKYFSLLSKTLNEHDRIGKPANIYMRMKQAYSLMIGRINLLAVNGSKDVHVLT
jgi:hypothetical protein